MERIQIPISCIGAVLGKQGKNKKYLETRFNTRIYVDEKGEITIRGEYEDRQMVIRKIRRKIQKIVDPKSFAETVYALLENTDQECNVVRLVAYKGPVDVKVIDKTGYYRMTLINDPLTPPYTPPGVDSDNDDYFDQTVDDEDEDFVLYTKERRHLIFQKFFLLLGSLRMMPGMECRVRVVFGRTTFHILKDLTAFDASLDDFKKFPINKESNVTFQALITPEFQQKFVSKFKGSLVSQKGFMTCHMVKLRTGEQIGLRMTIENDTKLQKQRLNVLRYANGLKKIFFCDYLHPHLEYDLRIRLQTQQVMDMSLMPVELEEYINDTKIYNGQIVFPISDEYQQQRLVFQREYQFRMTDDVGTFDVFLNKIVHSKEICEYRLSIEKYIYDDQMIGQVLKENTLNKMIDFALEIQKILAVSN